jgi:hypothetical protein
VGAENLCHLGICRTERGRSGKRLYELSRGWYTTRLPCVSDLGTAGMLVRPVPVGGLCLNCYAVARVATGTKGSAGPMIPVCGDQKQRTRACQDMAPALLGIEGVTVTEVEEGARGRLSVRAMITGPTACPACAVISERVHERVVTRPRDVWSGGREIDLFLVKRLLECAEEDCPQGTFTEWAPQVRPRCQITRRLLEHAGNEIAGRWITSP